MDAPHTGARLETLHNMDTTATQGMPPTRGHDLKQHADRSADLPEADAPHTGARLETQMMPSQSMNCGDAPHTGARLETCPPPWRFSGSLDAPHTGARLETLNVAAHTALNAGCPPHGGTT